MPYIIVAGLGGCGKEIAARTLAESWGGLTYKRVVITEEPSARNRVAIFAAASKLSPMAVVKMFYDDRVEVINGVVRPNLNAGNIVISKRGFVCTFAYQQAQGARFEDIYAEHLRRFGPNGCSVDLVYYLRLSDPKIGLERKARATGFEGDTFDEMPTPFHWKVLAEYDRMAEKYNFARGSRDTVFGRWLVINADRNISEVKRQLVATTGECVKIMFE